MAPPVIAYYTFTGGSALIGGYIVNHAANNISSKMNQAKAQPPSDATQPTGSSSPGNDSAAAGEGAQENLPGSPSKCGTGNCKDDKGSYKIQDEAAKKALGESNGKSIGDNKEYGGLIYKNSDGTYG